MDVNGTRFHLLLGRGDWGRRGRTESGQTLEASFSSSENGGDAELSWDATRDELTLGKRILFFRSSPGNQPVQPSQRRGAAMDRFGNVYWISPDRTEILVSSAATTETTHFWSSLDACNRVCDAGTFGGFTAIPGDTPDDAAQPIALSGLAVTTQHYLVAGTVDPPGLLVFDLQTGGEPRQLLWPVSPAPVPFAPFDLSAAKDGGVFILDRQGARVWRLDRTFAVVAHAAASLPHPEDFAAVDGSASHPAVRPSTLTLDLAIPIVASNPVAIAALPDGSFLILDSPPGATFSTILRYQDGVQSNLGSTGEAASLVESSPDHPFRLLGHDFAYVEKRAGTQEPQDDLLYVVGEDGDQAFAFQLKPQGNQIKLEPLAELFPMRLFAGKALLVGPSGQAFYDLDDRWVPLVSQRRARFAPSATFSVSELDGKQPDCVWHRLLIDACIPPECTVAIATRAGNDPALLPAVAWNEEPALLRRATGSELPWQTAEGAAGYDTWELLFQRAQGRYLDLRMRLSGSGRSTPRVRALRAWYPRFSYPDHYLPAAYRENAESASFLDRFLANFEGFFTNIEDRIAAVQLLLDVRSAPAEALEWLASWFGVALDPAWDETRRRLFLRHATDFFEWRGTVPGLQMALRLVLDDCPGDSLFDIQPRRSPAIRIVEKFSTRTVPAAVYSAVGAVAAAAAGTSAAAGGLPLRAQQAQWDASQGAAGLESRFTAATGSRYTAQAPNRQADPAGLAAWTEFSRQTLGFVPRAASGDSDLWRQFLQGRYPSLAGLNAAWSTSYADWSGIPLPGAPPRNAAALRDWLQFEGIVLPARDAAHRFTIYLPQSKLMADEKRLDLARRVVGLEKPAHTSFDVKFYWAFFRVGEARLGTDTLVDVGGRSPEFLAPFVLDRDFLGSGYLAPDRRSRLSSPCPRPDGGCPPSSTAGGSR
ncbi:MAG TPA: phage tail protein [Thermoanaerobaculia bacterium]|jgi:phage tail-like protein|nr:phage tail protein [Thermoanaerobaculia bacterium]